MELFNLLLIMSAVLLGGFLAANANRQSLKGLFVLVIGLTVFIVAMTKFATFLLENCI